MHHYYESHLQKESKFVLCIDVLEKIGVNSGILGHRLFILKDTRYAECYSVYGKIINQKKGDVFPPYYKQFDRTIHLLNYIKLILDTDSYTIQIINYNNLTDTTDKDYTYELFEHNLDVNYEVVLYDVLCYNEEQILNFLNSL